MTGMSLSLLRSRFFRKTKTAESGPSHRPLTPASRHALFYRINWH